MNLPVTELDVVPFPEALAAKYSTVLGDRTIPEELRAIVAAHPERPALITLDEELSFSELDRRTDRIAFGLCKLGLDPGDRVLVQFTNSGWAVLAWYGLLKAGLVPVATLAQHRRHEILDIAGQCEPTAHLIESGFPSQDLLELARETANHQPTLRVLLTVGAEEPPPGAHALEQLELGPFDDAEARAAVEEVQARIGPDALAVLQLSGGTTSTPKLIPRLHAEYWFNARAYAEGMDLGPDGCVPHLLPVIHNAGIVCALHAAHAVGASFALCAPDPEQLKALARKAPPTHMLMPPPIAEMIQGDAELRASLESLRVIIWVLSRPQMQVVEDFEAQGCVLGQMFGQSEGLCMITPLDAPQSVRLETVGEPLSGLDEVRVYAAGTEDPVPLGEPGELCCRGPYTIRGYYRSPQRNKEAFTADGFYRTGDVVSEVQIEGRSYYRLEDRIKDVINRGGEKVNAVEVEGLLEAHPAIAAAALVAMPDKRLGERGCAFVVPLAGAEAPDLEQVREYLDERGVAKFKWPERIEVREDLPRTNISKVDKKRLRAEIAALLEDRS